MRIWGFDRISDDFTGEWQIFTHGLSFQPLDPLTGQITLFIIMNICSKIFKILETSSFWILTFLGRNCRTSYYVREIA